MTKMTTAKEMLDSKAIRPFPVASVPEGELTDFAIASKRPGGPNGKR